MGAFDRDTPTAPVTDAANSDFGAVSKTVTINGQQITGIDPTTGKPPAAGGIGSISPSSGLAISGVERDKKQEAEAIAMGITPEYIASRGGINAQGYYNDTPTYSQLTAEERKQVTLPNGTMNTGAILSILEKKGMDFYYNKAYNQYKTENPEWTEENLISTAKDSGKRAYYKYELNQRLDLLGEKVVGGGGVGNANDTSGGSSTGSANSFGMTSSNGGTFVGFDSNNQPLFKYGSSNTPMTSEQYSTRVDTMDTMRTKFKDYGLESLIPTIEKLAIEGATESTIFLTLRESDAYKQRFSANEDRKKAGLAVLDPRTYLSVEDGYRQTLRSYGLTQFDNDNYIKKFIANDVSATELSNRVAAAVQRVQNADPAVMKTLTDYYGISQSDLAGYVLDPTNQFERIKRQISAAEIGATASKQGLQSDVGVSEQLAAQGVTEAQARQGYSAIADILPTAQKLSDIYGNQADVYNQSTAEQETFNGLASAQRKRQKLSALEVGTFSGQSGLSKSSLASKTSGQF